jgi:excisionase family DNA binding protein
MTENLELLTPSQVCEALKVSESTFYRLAKRGAIPVVRIGRSLRVRATALDAYLRKGES